MSLPPFSAFSISATFLSRIKMPNVLVLGAAGYIGRAVAHALTSSGKHTVYGLARTPEKAKFLSSMEVIPVMGSINDSIAYLELIRTTPIDLIIDVAAAFTDSHIVLTSLLKAGLERLSLAAASGVGKAGATGAGAVSGEEEGAGEEGVGGGDGIEGAEGGEARC